MVFINSFMCIILFLTVYYIIKTRLSCSVNFIGFPFEGFGFQLFG